jgi:SAM-dependent methyltransferase
MIRLMTEGESCDSTVEARTALSVSQYEPRRACAVNFEQYSGQMLAYYDNPSNDARNTHEARWARHYRREFETPGNWLREVALALQEQMRGRDVLELACGHCRWTPFVAEVARTVLVTDFAPNMLHWGECLFAHAAPKARNVRFRLADAYRVDEIEGTFDAASVINFFQHVPTARQHEFLSRLDSKLGPGGKVFLAANHLKSPFRDKLQRRADDLFSRRKRPDGTIYEIIDNIFDEESIHALLKAHGTDVSYTSGEEYWWATYTVR